MNTVNENVDIKTIINFINKGNTTKHIGMTLEKSFIFTNHRTVVVCCILFFLELTNVAANETMDLIFISFNKFRLIFRFSKRHPLCLSESYNVTW